MELTSLENNKRQLSTARFKVLAYELLEKFFQTPEFKLFKYQPYLVICELSDELPEEVLGVVDSELLENGNLYDLYDLSIGEKYGLFLFSQNSGRSEYVGSLNRLQVIRKNSLPLKELLVSYLNQNLKTLL